MVNRYLSSLYHFMRADSLVRIFSQISGQNYGSQTGVGEISYTSRCVGTQRGGVEQIRWLMIQQVEVSSSWMKGDLIIAARIIRLCRPDQCELVINDNKLMMLRRTVSSVNAIHGYEVGF